MTRLTGAGLFLVVFGALLRRACCTAFHDDSPETVIAALTLGVSHPPGDPPLILIGRIWLLLPLGTPAVRLNLLAAATFASVSVLLWLLISRVLPVAGRVACAALIAALVLTNPEVAHQAAVAKGASYGLSLLLLTAFCAAASTGWFSVTGLAMGLLASHHWMTAGTYGVVAIAAASQSVRPRRTRRAVTLGCLFMIAGLSTQLASPIRAGHAAYAVGGAFTARRYAAHIIRSSFLIEETKRPLADRLRQPIPIAASLLTQLGPVGSSAAFASLVFLIRSGLMSARPLILAVAAPPLVAGLYLALPPERSMLYDTFLLPTWWLLVAVVAAASARGRSRWWPAALAMAGVAHVACQAPAVADRTPARSTWAHDLARAQLAPLPPRAIILTVSDLDTFPLFHAGEADKFRRDIIVVNWTWLRHRWYRERMASALRIPALATVPDRDAAVGLIALLSQRPLFSVPIPFAGMPAGLRPSAYHLLVGWSAKRNPGVAPRGWTARGVHEALDRRPDWRADLAAGYTAETLHRLMLAARTGRL